MPQNLEPEIRTRIQNQKFEPKIRTNIFQKFILIFPAKISNKNFEKLNFLKCTCSRWTCIDEIDLSYIQSLISGPVSLLKDHEVDQQFKCWKTCCKKQGLFYLFFAVFFWLIDSWTIIGLTRHLWLILWALVRDELVHENRTIEFRTEKLGFGLD